MSAPELRFLKPPQVEVVQRPDDANKYDHAALTMIILRDLRYEITDYYEPLRAAATLHGYDGDGRARMWSTAEYGVGWIKQAVYFYDKVEP